MLKRSSAFYLYVIRFLFAQWKLSWLQQETGKKKTDNFFQHFSLLLTEFHLYVPAPAPPAAPLTLIHSGNWSFIRANERETPFHTSSFKKPSRDALSAANVSFNWPLWMGWNEVSLRLTPIAVAAGGGWSGRWINPGQLRKIFFNLS